MYIISHTTSYFNKILPKYFTNFIIAIGDNMQTGSNNPKRYQTLDGYYKQKYGKKVAKIALNANFTCPNKDGKKGFGGCTYCSPQGSGDLAGNPQHDLLTQFQEIKQVIAKKWPEALYVPYLQANSNTYGSIEKLKSVYEELLSIPNIVGISIATRADCFNKEIYDYLSTINQKVPLQIELGLQTSNEKTAQLINRQSTLQEFSEAVIELRKRNIEVVAHIINGLPYETERDMLNTIHYLNDLDIQGLKIHSLLIIKNTKMADDYLKNPFPILSLTEYVDITVKQIEHLRPDIIIHRLAADAVQNDLIAPLWTQKKLVVMNEIDKLLRKKDSYQGIYYSGQL